MSAPLLADAFLARCRIAGRVRRTPLAHSAWLSGVAGAQAYLKLESLQLTGSFKLRGALNAAMAIRERAGPAGASNAAAHLVAASAGNHGVALASAACQLGLRATIFTPRGAPRSKQDAIRCWGGELRAEADSYEEAERQAKAFAARDGATFVSPYAHPEVIAGAATIALEIVEDLPDVDLIVVPVGGGGLIAGIATAVKAMAPPVAVIGAEAAASPVVSTSLREGRITEVTVRPTLADGLAGNMDPASLSFEIVRRTVDRVVVIEETELAGGIRDLVAHEHLIAEGAGIAAVAALLAGKVAGNYRCIAAVVSGANIDLGRLAGLLAPRAG